MEKLLTWLLVGTGGTICGTGQYLKEKTEHQDLGNRYIWICPKIFRDTGKMDQNEIYPYVTEGIGEDFIPKNYDFKLIDHFEKNTDKDAALMTREIVERKEFGLVIQQVLQLQD